MEPVPRKTSFFLYCGLLLLGLAFFPGPGAATTDRAGLPMPVRAILAKAGALIKAKKIDQAIAALTVFQEQGKASSASGKPDPKGYHHPEVYFAMGTCHLLRHNYDAAAKTLAQAVRLDPAHVGAWLNLARASYERKDYSRAARCFEQAYDQADVKKPEHLYYSAVAYQLASRLVPCLSAFEKLFEKHADIVEPVWRENYVSALLTAGRPLQALPHIRQLAAHSGGEKQIQWQEILLQQYLQLDMQKQARNYAVFLTGQDPTRAEWWKALAHVDLQAGRYDQALVAMTIYSFLTPLNARETKLLADLNLQLGIPVKAAPLYEAALAEKPDTRLIRGLAMALQQSGRTEKALEALNRFAPPGRDQQAELAMLRADLLYALNRFDEAAAAYRRAAEGNPAKAGRAWLMAGYAALQIHDAVAGRQAFKKAAVFDRHRQAALTALRQLPKPQSNQTAGRSRI